MSIPKMHLDTPYPYIMAPYNAIYKLIVSLGPGTNPRTFKSLNTDR
jgi:hypothetical protein